MNTRTTLVLLAILAAVGVAIYFIEFYKPPEANATPTPSGSKAFLEVSSPAIDGITIRNVLSDTQVSVSRDISGTWWMTEPSAGEPGDPTTLNSLAARLTYIYVQRVLTPTGSLAEYGLLTPTLSVQVTAGDARPSFVVGDMTPSKGAYYAQKAGDPHVYLIETGIVEELRRLVSNPPIAVPPTPTLPPLNVPTPALP